MRTIRLSKLHATGNDFLVWSWLHTHAGVAGIDAAQAAALCDRHRGVGADGLIMIKPGADGADAEMMLYNADGGVAEMSGNGMRTPRLGRGPRRSGPRRHPHRRHRRRPARGRARPSGPARPRWSAATVDMGPVTFDPARIPLAAPSPFGLTRRLPRHALRGRRRRDGQPAPRAVRRRPRHRPGHPARSAPRARRPVPDAAPTSSSCASPPAPTTSSTCGSGSGGWARR